MAAASGERRYLAFDFGAESGRAILGTFVDGRLILEDKHRFSNPMGRINGRLCWDLLGQWEQIKQGLRTVRGVELRGIGVDTWGVDFGLLDGSGEILGLPVMYRDARTDGMLEEAYRVVPREEIFASTGIQFMQLNTLYQLLAMVRQDSSLLKVANKLLFMPDLFNYLLTGVAKSEYSIASTSQMYDPVRKAWATPILERLGIPTRILPEVVPSGTILGALRPEVQKECEVGPVSVITPASHDTGSAVAAVPVEPGKADWCYISSGTWSLMGVELDQPIVTPQSLEYNYTNEGGVNGTIRFLKNIMGMWLIQECRRQFMRDGHDHSYAELTQMAAGSKPFGCIIDPDHAPLASPGDMPNKIAAFCRDTRQPEPASRGAFIRTCIDSLALKYRQTLEGLEDLLGRRISVIHIVGGGCQNELLNQLTADVCDRTVVAGPIEATALGNILVQAIATGDVADLAAAREVVRQSFPVKQYQPRPSPELAEAYTRYRSLLGM